MSAEVFIETVIGIIILALGVAMIFGVAKALDDFFRVDKQDTPPYDDRGER